MRNVLIFSEKKVKIDPVCSLVENLVGIELIQILLLHIVWIDKLKLIAKDT